MIWKWATITFGWYTMRSWWYCFYIPPRKKVAGYYLILSEPFECPSIRPFPDSNFSSFWLIFFKLCINIDFREEWFGIENGLNSFINNIVMAFDCCNNVFFLNIFTTNGRILIKFSIYKIHVVSNAHYCWSIFNRAMALDRCQTFVYAQYRVN